jgi:hypothetical protein
VDELTDRLFTTLTVAATFNPEIKLLLQPLGRLKHWSLIIEV